MVPVLSLWLPIVVAAVLVFVVSSIIHILLPYHQLDLDDLPDEDAVRQALRPVHPPPGSYALPRAHSAGEMKDPAYVAKLEEGPVAFLDVRPNGVPNMGKQLAQWFVFSLVVGVFAAYIGGRALGPGAEYLSVFRFTGATAFVAYTLALWQMAIFFGKKWMWAVTFTFDGFVYALLTAGAFGWLWPA